MRRRASRGEPEPRTVSKRRRFPPASALRYQFGSPNSIEPSRVRALFRAAGWTEDIAAYSAQQIRKLLHHSHTVLTAWHQSHLVGLASAVSDGVLCAMVQNLVVHPRYRRRGLGTRLLRMLARKLSAERISCIYVLGMPGRRARAFFDRTGFRPLRWNVYLRLNH